MRNEFCPLGYLDALNEWIMLLFSHFLYYVDVSATLNKVVLDFFSTFGL